MVTVGLAIGVIIAVGMLLYIQLKSIIRNETGIESWIKSKVTLPWYSYQLLKFLEWLFSHLFIFVSTYSRQTQAY